MKEILNLLFEIGEALDHNGFGCAQLCSNRSTPNQMRIDFVSSLCFLISVDGVKKQELDFLESYFDYYTTKEELESHIKKLDDGQSFITKVPYSFQAFVNADKALLQLNSSHESNGSAAMLNTFYNLGLDLIACDNSTSEDEISALTSYIEMLSTYANSQGINIPVPYDDTRSLVLNEPIGHKRQNEEQKDETLQSLLDKLDNLIGLESVKTDVKSLINLLKVKKIRDERGIKQPPLSLHLVFSGNPGAGKTTVARLLSKIYNKLGFLSKGHLIETDRSGLVGGYVGQTAIKVKETVDRAIGGILFIDEAYSLTNDKGKDDYGQEAIEVLLKCMEDNRSDFVVIVAGYPELMHDFLSSNPGLKSRFNKHILFQDYSADELLRIFILMCSSCEIALSNEVVEYANNIFIQHIKDSGKNYANGRDVRNFFEKVLVCQADRLAGMEDVTNKDLTQFIMDDVVRVRM